MGYEDTMPPTGVPVESEEERNRRLVRESGGMNTMPPGGGMPPAVTPSSPDSRNYALSVGATNHPTMPPNVPGPKAEPTAPDLSKMPPATFAPPPTTGAAPARPADTSAALGMPPAGKPADVRSSAFQTMPPNTPGPAEKHEAELRAQGRPGSPEGPDLPWWKRVLDTIAQAHPIGRGIERNIPGSPGNFDWELARATAAGDRETNARKERLGERNTESEIASRGDKDETALAKIGMKRGPDGQIVPDENSEVYKGQQSKIQTAETTQKSLGDLRQAQTELAQARTEVENAKNDPNSPAYKAAQQKLAMAQRAHDIAAQNLGLHQQEFANKVQEQNLVKPGGMAQSRGSSAQAVLNLYDAPGKPGLESLVRKNAASMGPAIGRLMRGEIAIGDLPPDVSELVTAMESFYAMQPAVHGFKNHEFVKDFKTAMGYLERDPESFIAGMKGLRPTLESVAKEGRTYRPRIIEGGAGGEGGGAEKQIHNGFEYTKGADGQWHKGKPVQQP